MKKKIGLQCLFGFAWQIVKKNSGLATTSVILFFLAIKRSPPLNLIYKFWSEILIVKTFFSLDVKWRKKYQSRYFLVINVVLNVLKVKFKPNFKFYKIIMIVHFKIKLKANKLTLDKYIFENSHSISQFYVILGVTKLLKLLTVEPFSHTVYCIVLTWKLLHTLIWTSKREFLCSSKLKSFPKRKLYFYSSLIFFSPLLLALPEHLQQHDCSQTEWQCLE